MLGTDGAQRLTKSEKGKKAGADGKERRLEAIPSLCIASGLEGAASPLVFGMVWYGLGVLVGANEGERMAVSYLFRVAWVWFVSPRTRMLQRSADSSGDARWQRMVIGDAWEVGIAGGGDEKTTRQEGGFCLFFSLCKEMQYGELLKDGEKRFNSKVDLRGNNLDGHDGEGQGRSEKTELR